MCLKAALKIHVHVCVSVVIEYVGIYALPHVFSHESAWSLPGSVPELRVTQEVQAVRKSCGTAQQPQRSYDL